MKKKDIISWSIILTVASIGLWGYQHRLSALEESEMIKGQVVEFTRSRGRAISRPQVICRVVIQGEERLINYDTKELPVKIGECVWIRYSRSDSRITELLYERGSVPCH